MAQLNREQTLAVLSTLMLNADWSEIDANIAAAINADPVGSGRGFTEFLKNQARVQVVISDPKILFTIASDGRSTEKLVEDLKTLGRKISDWAARAIENGVVTSNGVTYKVVAIRGDEFKTDKKRTTKAIRTLAKKRKYITPPWWLALLLREKYVQSEIGAPYAVVMHEPIDASGASDLFGLHADGSEESLHTWYGYPGPGRQWDREYMFLFLAPEVE
jgi:hypothetical protein